MERTVIHRDPVGEKFILMRVDAAGNIVNTAGSVVIALGDCKDSQGNVHSLKVQEWAVCIDNGDGTFTTGMHALFLSSAPY